MVLQGGPDREKIYVGVDEVARGCLAGPVVAAAVIWNDELDHDLCGVIKDSKQLSKKKRCQIADFIKENSVDYGIEFVDNNIIDKVNIYNATMQAMHGALSKVVVDFNEILVDGNSFRSYKDYNHSCIVGGDNKYIAIAAASILAKTEHDTFMEEVASKEFPEYNWGKNQGYGTKEHLEAIKKHGISRYHRKSYSPCKM